MTTRLEEEMTMSAHATDGPQVTSLRTAAPLWAILAVFGGIAWAVTIPQARTMGAGPGTMGMGFAFFVGMWAVMMAAMMLPAIGLMAADRVLHLDRPGAGGRIPSVLAFGAGFLVPWAGYGVLAFLALVGTGKLVEAAPEEARWVGVAILAVAGLYQLSPWKLRALHHCRRAMVPVVRTRLIEGFAAGTRDGGVCVGCCWALMTILLAVGVMNVLAMAGLGLVIFAEKVLPRPRLIAGLAGVTFLALAVVAAFEPSLLPGLSTTGSGMEMGGAGMSGVDMGGM
jgi:predicted metal-binding membrane protein